MKEVAISILITILILFISIYSIFYLDNTSSILIKELDEVDAEISLLKWNEAEIKLKKLDKHWNDYKKIWAVIIDHEEIDNIDVSMEHIKSFIKTKSFVQIKSEIAGLYLFFKHIPEIEKFSVENIF